MADDMEIIKQIEKKIGKKLEPAPIEKIMRLRENGFVLDDGGQVTGLKLNDKEIADISFLRGLAGLTHLSLQNNQITVLTPLSALTNLIELILNDNQITDLTPLSALMNLTILDLRYNQITDLTPLSVLTNIKELYLNNNQITDLKPLLKLPQLKVLDLRNNKIAKISPNITMWWPHMGIKWEKYLDDGLNLYENPLTDPPVEIVKHGHEAVLNATPFFFSNPNSSSWEAAKWAKPPS
jgi:Leucine-rich repeat (LRR) protein